MAVPQKTSVALGRPTLRCPVSSPKAILAPTHAAEGTPVPMSILSAVSRPSWRLMWQAIAA